MKPLRDFSFSLRDFYVNCEAVTLAQFNLKYKMYFYLNQIKYNTSFSNVFINTQCFSLQLIYSHLRTWVILTGEKSNLILTCY